jgi:hypothetical protein
MRLHQELIAERVTEWASDAVMELTAADADAAARIAEEALAIVRFFMRPHVRVNVAVHKIGLVRQIPDGIRRYIVLWDHDQPIAGDGWETQRRHRLVPLHRCHSRRLGS